MSVNSVGCVEFVAPVSEKSRFIINCAPENAVNILVSLYEPLPGVELVDSVNPIIVFSKFGDHIDLCGESTCVHVYLLPAESQPIKNILANTIDSLLNLNEILLSPSPVGILTLVDELSNGDVVICVTLEISDLSLDPDPEADDPP